MPLRQSQALSRRQRQIEDPNNRIGDTDRAKLLIELAQQQEVVKANNKANGFFGGSGGGSLARFQAKNLLGQQRGTLSTRELSLKEKTKLDLQARTAEAGHKASLAERAASAKARQGRSDVVWESLVKAASDPSNPMTHDELMQGVAQFEQEHSAGNVPNPVLLKSKFEEEDTPELALIRDASSLANQYNVSPDFVSPLMALDENGKPDKKHNLKVAEFLRSQGVASTQQMSAVRNAMKVADDEVQRLAPLVLDTETGNPLPEPSDQNSPFFANRTMYDAAVAKRAAFGKRVMGFADPAEEPLHDLRVNQPAPKAAPTPVAVAAPVGKLEGSGTKAQPFVLTKDMDAKAAQAAAAWIKGQAQTTKQSVVVQLPDGSLVRINP